MKSKLGVSVGLVGAALYFAGLFNGMLLLLVLIGYVLLVEDNEWLRRTAVKSGVIYVMFALLLAVIGLIPGVIGLIGDFLGIFGGSFSIPFITSIIIFIESGIELIKVVFFILLGIKALNQGTIVIPFVDNFVNKYIQ